MAAEMPDMLNIDQMIDSWISMAKAHGKPCSRLEATVEVLRIIRSGEVPMYGPNGRKMRLPKALRDADWLDRVLDRPNA
jgi:hypothetical protein